MIRPTLEVADILRALRNRFLKRFKSSRSYQQLKVFRAIERCRTAALGGHKDKCVGCEYEAPFSYNSCRSRCCPKCQAQARQRWIEARQRELLPTNYFHVVFTVPHELNGFARTSPAVYYNLALDTYLSSAISGAGSIPAHRLPHQVPRRTRAPLRQGTARLPRSRIGFPGS